MKRIQRFGRVAAIGAALALTLSACGGSDDSASESRELRFSYMAGEATPIGEVWTWWLDEIEKRTNGELKFERFWDATLLGSTETAEGLADGRADVGQVLPTVYAGKYPLSSVGELPFESSNTPAVSAALTKLSADEDGLLAGEWASHDLVPLAWSVGGPSALATNKEIKSASDLKGVRLRANDRGSKVLKPAGANLINIELAEIYGSMQRKLVDGIYGIPFSFTSPLKYPEVASHFTDLGIGVSTVNGLAMSQDTWKSLTDEQREVVREVSAEVPAKIAEVEAAWDARSCEAVKAAGDSVSVLDAAEVEKLKAGGKAAVDAEWKEQAKKAGADPDAFYAEYRTALEAAEQEHSDFKTGVAVCAAG